MAKNIKDTYVEYVDDTIVTEKREQLFLEGEPQNVPQNKCLN